MTLTNYWWLLIWLFTGGVVLAALIPKKSERVLGTLEERWRIVPAVLLVLPYIIWAGYRSDNFGDTYAYREVFKEAPSSLSGLITYVENADKDKGFSVLTALIKSIVGNSDVIFFIVVATIQIVCIIYIYRKYSENYWLSIFLFVASTDYMSWVHNGMRQFLAVTITLVAMEFIVKEKYLKAVIFILIAFTFHASALLMLPMISLETKTEELIKRMDALERSHIILAGKIDKAEQRIMDIEFIIETRLAQDIHAVAEGHSFVNSKLAYLIETMQKYRDIPMAVHYLYYEFQQMKRQKTTA